MKTAKWLIILFLPGVVPGLAQSDPYELNIQSQVNKLQEQLLFYNNLQDTLYSKNIPDTHIFSKGDSSLYIKWIKHDLNMLCDMTDVNDTTWIFTPETEIAVKNFQGRMGIDDDGVVGRETLSMLKHTPDEIINQIECNINRWEYFLADSVRRTLSIVINIPDFRLWAMENGQPVFSMRAIVGKPSSQTPVMNNRLKYVVFNPSWTIPQEIVLKEIIPLLKKDSCYLEDHGMHVFRMEGKHKVMVNTDSIESWSDDFTIEQSAGILNPLGRIKFMLQNDQAIYMHDTPDKNLFHKTLRAFSHGCIRLEDPEMLCAWLFLGDTLKEYRKEIDYHIKNSNENTYLKLPEEVMVFITYFTAWVSNNEKLQLRRDLYQYDRSEVVY